MITPTKIELRVFKDPKIPGDHTYVEAFFEHHEVMRVDRRYAHRVEVIDMTKRLAKQAVWTKVYGDLIPLITDLETHALKSAPYDKVLEVRELVDKIRKMLNPDLSV